MTSPRVTQILAEVVGDGHHPTPLATRLCQLCAVAVSVSGVGLSLMNATGPNGTVAATDGPAREMEELQFATGEGPCVDASRSGRPALHPDLRASAASHWPGYGPAVLATGVRAIFAFPLQVGAIRIGALDLYRDKPGSLTDADLADTLAFADAATILLLHLGEHAEDEGASGGLTAAMDSRAVVHQATGMISVQLSVAMGEALLRLRAHAYAEESSVVSVAAEVVGRRLRFDDSDTGASRTVHDAG